MKNENLGYNADMFEQDAPATQSRAVDNGLNFMAQDNRDTLSAYAAKTFLWMFLGLLSTFAVAFTFYASGAVSILFTAPMLPFVLAIAEVVVVIALSARLQKMSVGAARGMFFLYAVLNGITFASLFAYYGVATLILVFGMTSLYFGALALYGWLTKRDLTSLRPILVGGLIFLLLFGLLSMFLRFTAMDTLMCFVGLAIFMGFTAYDTQKIKTYYNTYGGNAEMAGKTSIICALQLYLDFINLFLYLLRIFARNRD